MKRETLRSLGLLEIVVGIEGWTNSRRKQWDHMRGRIFEQQMMAKYPWLSR